MSWRERFLASVGPGTLGGITAGQWIRLLRAERFAIDAARIPRALAITAQSLKNSLFRACEERRYGPQLAHVRIKPPIFVLGHWRNGTTHLHQLLAQDRRFAFPNGYQVTFPHSFLTTEALDARWMQLFLPRRRPMDNVTWTVWSPQEDEFALAAGCLKSPYLAWVFPRHRNHYGRYLTFQRASPTEIAEWRAAFDWFMRKLTLKHPRPLVLKSPPHTCRIRLLLEMFPGAKFVHIHRDPYVVFQSCRKMFQAVFGWQQLQRWPLHDLDDWILQQYREMYDAFFEERTAIPPGAYHEMGFENLEQDPMGELRRLYAALELPDFGVVADDLQRYTDSLHGYRKNEFPALAPGLKARIDSMWGSCLEEWGYRSGM